MTALEVTLIVIGLIFLVGSFFIKDKLSQKDIDRMAKLSETELKILVDKNLKNAGSQIEDSIEESLADATEGVKRQMEKETNEKIMAISEYSDTVLESINKSHNEIMFLYSMLNDKHKDLTELASQLQEFSDNMKDTENELLGRLSAAAGEMETRVEETNTGISQDEIIEAAAGLKEDETNHNDQILILHRQGKTDIEIAKELGIGLGEIKLVIGLFKGEIPREA